VNGNTPRRTTPLAAVAGTQSVVWEAAKARAMVAAPQVQDTSVHQRNGNFGQRQHDKTPYKSHAGLVRSYALLGFAISPWLVGGRLTLPARCRRQPSSHGASSLQKTTESTDRRYEGAAMSRSLAGHTSLRL
jgi:hypothetical protein